MQSTDLRLILHQLGNLAQPLTYHVEKLGELKTNDPSFNSAMAVLPGRLAALNGTIDRLRILAKPVEPDLGRVDLCALLKSVGNEISNEHRFKSVARKLNFNVHSVVKADSYWLHLAMRELMINAAEAAAVSSQQSIEIRIMAQDSSWRL